MAVADGYLRTGADIQYALGRADGLLFLAGPDAGGEPGTPLAGVVTATSTVAGAVTVTAALSGVVTGTSGAAGAAVVRCLLGGAVAASSTVAGTLVNMAPVVSVGWPEGALVALFLEGESSG